MSLRTPEEVASLHLGDIKNIPQCASAIIDRDAEILREVNAIMNDISLVKDNAERCVRNICLERIRALFHREPETKGPSRTFDALLALYNHNADFIRTNFLGDIHHNKVMQDARDALVEDGWQQNTEELRWGFISANPEPLSTDSPDWRILERRGARWFFYCGPIVKPIPIAQPSFITWGHKIPIAPDNPGKWKL